MRYRAVAKVRCAACARSWVIDTGFSAPGFIEAKSEAEAAERFRLLHRLCPTCLEGGSPVPVEFDGYIRIDLFAEAAAG